MDSGNYQHKAKRTLIEKPETELNDKSQMVLWCSVGLSGEVGELLNHLKKYIFHGEDFLRDYAIEEVGDILWYLSSICTILNIDLSEAMRGNIEKLKKRYPNGFTQLDSIARVDKNELNNENF
jgi:NTP pyrophosphatase (non-canonical NTP hydrolase)